MAPADLATFRTLVLAKARNEVACANMLKRFAQVLLPAGRHELYDAGSEIDTRRGRCDLVLLADEHVSDQESKRVAFVWELKAPQCFVFARDGKERARPSDDLYSAENQLLHYLKSLRSDREWQTEKKILAEQDIRPGGIIIGRENTLMEHSPSISLARRAKEIRREFFYCDRFRLLDWDEVLWHVENLPNTRRRIKGDLNGPARMGDPLRTSAAANRALQRAGRRPARR